MPASSAAAPRKTRAARLRLLLLLAAAALALAAAIAAHQHWQKEQRQQAALQKTLAADARLRIPRGTSLDGIAAIAAAHLPVEAAMFAALAQRQQVAASLQAGVYDFAAGQTVAEVLHGLATGQVAVEKITFVEGRTYAQLRAQLARDTRLRQELPAMSDADIRQALGASAENLEGLFSPDTYFFQPGDSDLSVLRRAHRQLGDILDRHWEKRQDGGVFATPYEALILASIVEKEAGQAEERPLIASVFVNRLRKKMRLQADPTVIYGLGDSFDGNLTRAHLRRQDTPYNTYMRAGLPPTPIALASEAAVEAALNPPDTDYYYFVAKGDGSHQFSSTLRQHNNAVNRYQRRRK